MTNKIIAFPSGNEQLTLDHPAPQPTPEERVQVTLRVPLSLYRLIYQLAQVEGRSINELCNLVLSDEIANRWNMRSLAALSQELRARGIVPAEDE